MTAMAGDNNGKRTYPLHNAWVPLSYIVFTIGVAWGAAQVYAGQQATNDRHAQGIANAATKEEVRALRAEEHARWMLFRASFPPDLRPAVPELPR